MIRTIILGTLFAACSSGLNYDDVYEGESHGRISGIVTTTDGLPLSGVTVTAQDVEATTSVDGVYTLLDVNPADTIVVQFSKQGYARNYTTTALQSWENVASNASLLEADGFAVVNGIGVSSVSIEGTRVSFSENSFIDSDGNQYSGEVTVQVTHVDPSTSEIWGAPTDLTAIAKGSSDTTKDVTETLQLVSYGMVDVALFDEDGKELNISEDSPASLEIPITNGSLPELYQLSDGDTQSSWSFDTQRGMWIEEGVGNIVEEDGNTYFQFEASHFSWWNCDQGMVPSCASGRVVDISGFPIRGAEVTCDGTQSTSVATTDDEGYYVCSVLVGDTVTFTGATVVDNRNWLQATSKFMDGEGSSAAECEPIEVIKIDVCRIAGTINVQNMDASNQMNTGLNADTLGAYFWEPPGDPHYCDNLWESLGSDECWTGDVKEIQLSFPEGSKPGISDDSRSVGTWLEVRTLRDSYRIDRQTDAGQPLYVWESHSVDGTQVSEHRTEFDDGDILDIQAPGDYSSYFGAWNVEGFDVIPNSVQFGLNSNDPLVLDGNLSISYDGKREDNVFVTAMVGETMMVCKFDDDGHFTLNSSGLDEGFGGLAIQHISENLFEGPDGLPIRTQVFSGESVVIDVQ
jgi:hypothetical protein